MGQLGIPYWCNHAVKAYANKDNKDGFVDVKDDVSRSPEKKYEREIDKLGNELHDRWQATGVFEQK
jgi:hypothetical protein